MKKSLYSQMLSTGIKSEAQIWGPSKFSLQGQFNTATKDSMTELTNAYKALKGYVNAYAKFQSSKNRGSVGVDFAAFDKLFGQAQNFVSQYGNISSLVKQINQGLASSINNDSFGGGATPSVAPAAPAIPSAAPSIPPMGANFKNTLFHEALFGMENYVQWGDRAVFGIQQQYPAAMKAITTAISAMDKIKGTLTFLQNKVSGQPVFNTIQNLNNILNTVQSSIGGTPQPTEAPVDEAEVTPPVSVPSALPAEPVAAPVTPVSTAVPPIDDGFLSPGETPATKAPEAAIKNFLDSSGMTAQQMLEALQGIIGGTSKKLVDPTGRPISSAVPPIAAKNNKNTIKIANTKRKAPKTWGL